MTPEDREARMIGYVVMLIVLAPVLAAVAHLLVEWVRFGWAWI